MLCAHNGYWLLKLEPSGRYGRINGRLGSDPVDTPALIHSLSASFAISRVTGEYVAVWSWHYLGQRRGPDGTTIHYGTAPTYLDFQEAQAWLLIMLRVLGQESELPE